MTQTEELRQLAEYLGCNEEEFISEVSKLLATQKQQVIKERYNSARGMFGFKVEDKRSETLSVLRKFIDIENGDVVEIWSFPKSLTTKNEEEL